MYAKMDLKLYEFHTHQRLKLILDSFANCLSRTSICVRAFAAWICHFVTFFVSIKASGN